MSTSELSNFKFTLEASQNFLPGSNNVLNVFTLKKTPTDCVF